MLCPACHESNPERNRFCGQCGAWLGQSVSPTRVAVANGLQARGQRGSRPSTVEPLPKVEPLPPLPKEVIDYDNQLPLLAEPGMDRRQSFGSLRQAMQQARENQSSDVSPAQTGNPVPGPQPKAPAPEPTLEEIWNTAMASEAENHAPAPLALAPAPSPASTEETQIGPDSLDPHPTEAPGNAEPPAEDLSRFLDFTPTRNEDETASLSGPSFLGLSGDTESVESRPEPKTRRWPRYLAGGLIAAAAALMLMHGTSLRDTASRYARVGVSYANLLRNGITKPTVNPGPDASAGSASGTPSAPDFVVEQRPANPAQAAAITSPAPETHAAPEAQPAPQSAPQSAQTPQPAAAPATTASSVPESPANAMAEMPPNSAPANPAGETSQTSVSPSQTPAAERKQLAKAKPPAEAPARQSERTPQVAGQGEYRQAMAAANPEVARALLWRATALGNADAQVRLADMYIYGDGVPQNCDQGLVLLRSAAQKANSRARGKLGALYATGKCVSQNRVEAYRWLSLALKDNQGSEWTEKNREMVWRQMSPTERSRVATAVTVR